MIRTGFIDSDIILDVATGRKPFIENSRKVLSLMENTVVGMVSSNIITNVYYILSKLSTAAKAKRFIGSLMEYISVIPVDHRNVLDALDSDFSDFEDAVQYFSALSNNCDCIITRNVDDYIKSKLKVYSPKEFLLLFPSSAE